MLENDVRMYITNKISIKIASLLNHIHTLFNIHKHKTSRQWEMFPNVPKPVQTKN